MRGVWVVVATVVAFAARAGAGGGFEFIDIDIEGGLVELSVTIDPPDGPPATQTEQVAVNWSVNDSLNFGDANAGGDAYFEFEVSPSTGQSFLRINTFLGAGQSGFGYAVTARVRTLQPIVFRLYDEVRLDVFDQGGEVVLTPVSGMIVGDVICPGTYAISFDHTLALGPGGSSADLFSEFFAQLTDALEPEAQFTGAGELFVTGVSTNDQGVEDSAFAQGGIGDAHFGGGGGTSSGPVQGMAQSSGEITDHGNGAYTLTFSAAASATQPAGYQGSCFIGVFGEGIILELSKPKRYAIAASGAGSVSLTPTTGSVSAGVLGPGRYRLDFNASASISPGQAADSESIDWTLSLSQPGCSGADLADPAGVLDFSDVAAFLVAFAGAQPAADLSPPLGVWDFSDVLAFLVLFGAGCP